MIGFADGIFFSSFTVIQMQRESTEVRLSKRQRVEEEEKKNKSIIVLLTILFHLDSTLFTSLTTQTTFIRFRQGSKDNSNTK